MPRRNQSELTGIERDIFLDAVDEMVSNESYQRLYTLHQNPYDNHNMSGDLGIYRFLPWHRCFLFDFEHEFKDAQRAIGVPAGDLLDVPYWRWKDGFPAWLDGYTTPLDPSYPNPARQKTSTWGKPTTTDVKNIIENSENIVPWEGGRYYRFTWALEGLATPDNGLQLVRAHAHVHEWIGGAMANVIPSPADPVFWLVHAEVDRLWHIWQKDFGGEDPPFFLGNLDPWDLAYDDVVDRADYDSREYEDDPPRPLN